MIATTTTITATSPELNKTESMDYLPKDTYGEYSENRDLSMNKRPDQSSRTLRSINLCLLRMFNWALPILVVIVTADSE